MNDTTSCWKCKYLYADGTGYSNYTWMETYAKCALGLNPNLKVDKELPSERYRHNCDELLPAWTPISGARCSKYDPCAEMVVLDPDRTCWPNKYEFEPQPFHDQEQLTAVWIADGNVGAPLPVSEYLKLKAR